MNIELIRTSTKGEAIDGTLKIDGEKLCDTAENTEGALPVGTYQVVRHFCHQYNRFVPLIVSTVNRQASSESLLEPPETLKPSETPETFCKACEKLSTVSNNTNMPLHCPQLKMGNGIHNRNDGSIILGTRIISGCLKNTREPYENLSERIRKLAGRGSEITLTIKDIKS